MRPFPLFCAAVALAALLFVTPSLLWREDTEEDVLDIISSSVLGSRAFQSQLLVDTSAEISHTADDFICATLDWWPPEKCDYGTCAWDHASLLNLNLSHPTLRHAMQELAPFVLRLGGSLQDHIVYQVGDPEPASCPPITPAPEDRLGFLGGCLPIGRWDAINDLCRDTGCQLAFGLNALSGRQQVGPTDWEGSWDPTNAVDLIQYTAKKGYPIHSWQLGNEIGGVGGIAAHISAEQYAADALTLKAAIAKAYQGGKGPLLGAANNYYEPDWYSAFLNATGPGVVDVVTRHNYFLGAGVDPQLQKHILSPQYLANDEQDYVKAATSMRQLAPRSELWIGESGGAYNSGHHLLTDAFISGFWYLDQLGLAASNHHSRHCRQTLVGGNYGLLNTTTFEPNPDFYSALMWQRLMGSRVLRVRVSGRPSLRAYAHCHRNAQGGLMLLILNLHKSARQEVSIQLQGPLGGGASVQGTRLEEYHFTAFEGNLHSQITVLNGRQLSLSQVSNLSGLAVVRERPTAGFQVAPRSYAFVGLPDAQLLVCGGSSKST